jgi:hypothetical protein
MKGMEAYERTTNKKTFAYLYEQRSYILKDKSPDSYFFIVGSGCAIFAEYVSKLNSLKNGFSLL